MKQIDELISSKNEANSKVIRLICGIEQRSLNEHVIAATTTADDKKSFRRDARYFDPQTHRLR